MTVETRVSNTPSASPAPRTNLHALICRQQLQPKLMRCESLPTLVCNDVAYRPFRAEIFLAVHDIYSQTREHAVQRFWRERRPFLFLARTRRRGRAGFTPALGRFTREDDLGRERNHLLDEMFRTKMTPQHLVRPTGGIRALDKHRREVVWDLGRRCPPDGDVPRFDGDAVRFDVAEKDEFVLGGNVFEEETGAFVGSEVVLAVADRHAAYRDVGEDRLVFTIGVEAEMHGPGGETDEMVRVDPFMRPRKVRTHA